MKDARYVGDEFNCKGDNTNLIQDRVNSGKQYLRTCFAECGDVTLGVHAIQVLLCISLYFFKVFFQMQVLGQT